MICKCFFDKRANSLLARKSKEKQGKAVVDAFNKACVIPIREKAACPPLFRVCKFCAFDHMKKYRAETDTDNGLD